MCPPKTSGQTAHDPIWNPACGDNVLPFDTITPPPQPVGAQQQSKDEAVCQGKVFKDLDFKSRCL